MGANAPVPMASAVLRMGPGAFQPSTAAMIAALVFTYIVHSRSGDALSQTLVTFGLFILVGTIIGIVGKAEIVDGSAIREGDLVVALESGGLQTNGFSLARAALGGDYLAPLDPSQQLGQRQPGARRNRCARLLMILQPGRTTIDSSGSTNRKHDRADQRDRRDQSCNGHAHVCSTGRVFIAMTLGARL